ncbi:MAG: RHS repeat-associated core domain-containing protein, partial [Vulcanimicrobiota bacterium]
TAFDGSYRRLLQLKVPKGLQTTDGFRTVSFDYNDADNPDNVTSITNDLGHSVLTEYDIKDRVTKVTDARGKSTEFTFLDGLLDEVHLPANNGTSGEPRSISLVYDPHARLTEVRRDIDANNQQMIVKYAYNGFSELEKLIRLKDTVEKSFAFTRNALGRELTVEDPLQKITQTVWQSSCYGNSRTSARGVRVKTGVDMLCRISEIEAGDPEAFSSQDIDPVRETRTFHHDELGRLVKSTQLNPSRYGQAVAGIDRYGEIPEEKLYEHDELDRLVKMSFRRDGDPAGARDETLSFEHDEEGNVTKITDPQGNVTEYTYYRDNLLYQVIIKRPDQPDRIFTYRYDAAGRLEEIEYPEDTEIKAIFKDASNTPGSGFDPNGNLMFLRYEKDGVLIRRFEFSYDDSNNRQSMLDVTPTRAVKWEYGFDWLDRLVTVKRAQAENVGSLPASPLGSTYLQREYAFDESDNRTFFDDHVAGVSYHYTYKSIDDNGTTRWSDQLEEVLVSSTVGERNPANFSSFESFEHDDDGNLTARIITATGEAITFVWDDFDRLKRVESDQNGRMQDARYGVDGLRKRKLDKSGQNSVEYGVGISAAASIPGTVSSNAPRISYIMGHMILGCEIDGEFRYHLGDALSSVRDVVDDDGEVLRSLEFDEYGNLLNSSGSGMVSPKTWIGGLSVNDDWADSGMFNMGHRSYAAGVLGRFISRDPIGHAGGLNLYGYGDNNPVTYTDPTGLLVWALPALPAIFEGVSLGYAVGVPAAIGVGVYLGDKLAEGTGSLPSVEQMSMALPHHAAGPMDDLRFMSRPWDDASIYQPGDLNIASMKSSDPCDKVPLRGKSVTSGKKKLEKAGLKEASDRRRGGRAWVDVAGEVRAAWDRATKKWGSHWHKFDADGNSLNDAGRRVDPRDPAAHIPDGSRRVKRKGSRGSTTPML